MGAKFLPSVQEVTGSLIWFEVKMRQKGKVTPYLFLHFSKKQQKKHTTDNKAIISSHGSPRMTTFCFHFTWNHHANPDFSAERYGQVDGCEFPKLIITRRRRENNSPLHSFAAVKLEFGTWLLAYTVKLCLCVKIVSLSLIAHVNQGNALSHFVEVQALAERFNDDSIRRRHFPCGWHLCERHAYYSYIFEAPQTPASQQFAPSPKVGQEQWPWQSKMNQRHQRLKQTALKLTFGCQLISHRNVRELHYWVLWRLNY